MNLETGHRGYDSDNNYFPHYLFSTSTSISTSTSTSTSNSNPICIPTSRLHVMCYLYIFQECTSSHDLQCDSTVLQQGGHVIEGP